MKQNIKKTRNTHQTVTFEKFHVFCIFLSRKKERKKARKKEGKKERNLKQT